MKYIIIILICLFIGCKENKGCIEGDLNSDGYTCWNGAWWMYLEDEELVIQQDTPQVNEFIIVDDKEMDWTAKQWVTSELSFNISNEVILTIIPKENKIIFNEKYTQEQNAQKFILAIKALLKNPDWDMCN